MAAVADWSVPFSLITPKGTLLLNQLDAAAGGWWILDKDGCSTRRDPRITRDDRSQASGEIRHPPFSAGYQMNLKLGAWKTPGEIACDELLQQMWDVLMLHANAIFFDDPVVDVLRAGRVVWTPKGLGAVDRMLNNIWTIQLPDEATEPESVATLSVLSEFPYAWDAPETVTAIAEGSAGAATLHNGGTADFYPVVKVHGPFTTFTLTNESVVDQNGDPLQVVYDGSLPGAPTIAGGHYIELVFYRETAYKDGNGANAKPGIDILASDFFPLVPGDNVLIIQGATCDVLWQPAWA